MTDKLTELVQHTAVEKTPQKMGAIALAEYIDYMFAPYVN